MVLFGTRHRSTRCLFEPQVLTTVQIIARGTDLGPGVLPNKVLLSHKGSLQCSSWQEAQV